MTTWRPPALNLGWETVLRQCGIYPLEPAEPFGPMGVQVRVSAGDARGSVIITQADWEDGSEWLHASIALLDRDPTYLELVALHRAVFGRKRFAYQQFLPESDHVNLHEHALHLWGRVDGKPVAPYGKEGTV